MISWSDWRTMRVPLEYATKQNEAERNEKIFRCCFVWFRFISTGNETKPNETNRIFGFVSIGFVLFWFVSFRSVSFRTLHVPYYEYIKMLALLWQMVTFIQTKEKFQTILYPCVLWCNRLTLPNFAFSVFISKLLSHVVKPNINPEG